MLGPVAFQGEGSSYWGRKACIGGAHIPSNHLGTWQVWSVIHQLSRHQQINLQQQETVYFLGISRTHWAWPWRTVNSMKGENELIVAWGRIADKANTDISNKDTICWKIIAVDGWWVGKLNPGQPSRIGLHGVSPSAQCAQGWFLNDKKRSL